MSASVPRCLASLHPEPVPASDLGFRRGAEVSLFRFGCACGGRSGRILGHTPPGEVRGSLRRIFETAKRSFLEALGGTPQAALAVGLLAPLIFRCDECERETVFFDPARDGSRARMRQEVAALQSLGVEAFRCRPCHGLSMRPIAVFHYGVTAWRKSGLEPPQDYFDCFELFAQCAACGRQVQVCSIPCAAVRDVWARMMGQGRDGET